MVVEGRHRAGHGGATGLVEKDVGRVRGFRGLRGRAEEFTDVGGIHFLKFKAPVMTTGPFKLKLSALKPPF